MKERNHTNIDSMKFKSMKKIKNSNVVFSIQNLVRAPKLQFMKERNIENVTRVKIYRKENIQM